MLLKRLHICTEPCKPLVKPHWSCRIIPLNILLHLFCSSLSQSSYICVYEGLLFFHMRIRYYFLMSYIFIQSLIYVCVFPCMCVCIWQGKFGEVRVQCAGPDSLSPLWVLGIEPRNLGLATGASTRCLISPAPDNLLCYNQNRFWDSNRASRNYK